MAGRVHHLSHFCKTTQAHTCLCVRVTWDTWGVVFTPLQVLGTHVDTFSFFLLRIFIFQFFYDEGRIHVE